MRKNLLANVLETSATPRIEAVRHGAARSMTRSIEELAENARRMQNGEVIASIDVDLIDGSFVSDRIDEDDEDYAKLRDAIAGQGQSTPILVRPHPKIPGRYMIVYGHRRTRVARELGRPVRAVIKDIEDIAHIVAQGQENTARANLSFVEKALFAKKLLDMGQGKDTIKAALSVDDSLLSRMLSVTDVIPTAVIDAVGAAKGVGRDRWEDLKKQLTAPARARLAGDIIKTEEFLAKDGATRFDHLLTQVRAGRRGITARRSATKAHWTAPDRTVEAAYKRADRGFSLSLSSKNGGEFGVFISANLERLYAEFRSTKARDE